MEKLNLIINIDKNSGFCFGVTNAIVKAETVLNKKGKLYCLGKLVHNEEELKRLKKQGLKIIEHSDLKNIKNEEVLFRAHGEPPDSYILAKKNNNEIIDASCPTILKIQKLIKEAYENKENIYIYGKHNHPEIIGLNGQIDKKAVVFEGIHELETRKLPDEMTLFSQTTKDINNFIEIAEFLKRKGIKVTLRNTICKKVYNRQMELSNFASSHDKIILVAGKDSSNGRVLFDECKKINPESYFISSANEIREEWFNKNESVGIYGATSTPMWLMLDVEKHLKSF